MSKKNKSERILPKIFVIEELNNKNFEWNYKYQSENIEDIRDYLESILYSEENEEQYRILYEDKIYCFIHGKLGLEHCIKRIEFKYNLIPNEHKELILNGIVGRSNSKKKSVTYYDDIDSDNYELLKENDEREELLILKKIYALKLQNYRI